VVCASLAILKGLRKIAPKNFIVAGIGFFGKKWRDLLQKQPLEIPGDPLRELMIHEPVQERRSMLLKHFIESIEQGKQPEASILDNQKTLAVVFGSIESVLTKSEIRTFRDAPSQKT
jgi:hypothetical protein